MEQLVCPRDGSDLAQTTVGAARFSVCHACGGLWTTRAALEEYRRSPSEAWKLPPSAITVDTSYRPTGAIQCTCEGSPVMREVVQRAVTVDVCENCGAIWLDGGELAALIGQPSDVAGFGEKWAVSEVVFDFLWLVVKGLGAL